MAIGLGVLRSGVNLHEEGCLRRHLIENTVALFGKTQAI